MFLFFPMYYCCSVIAGNIICFARVCVCCLLCYLVCLYERVCVKLLCVQILFSQSALMPVSRWVTHQTIEDPRQGTDNTIIKKSFSFFFPEKDGIPSKLKKKTLRREQRTQTMSLYTLSKTHVNTVISKSCPENI